MGTIQTLKLTA
ncbi:hypothetical protein CPC197_0774A, partial [Chlamydia psittaci C1/97]